VFATSVRSRQNHEESVVVEGWRTTVANQRTKRMRNKPFPRHVRQPFVPSPVGPPIQKNAIAGNEADCHASRCRRQKRTDTSPTMRYAQSEVLSLSAVAMQRNGQAT